MIVLTGCAKRNADRELARVLALIERHVHAAGSAGLSCAVAALHELRVDLEQRKHREDPP